MNKNWMGRIVSGNGDKAVETLELDAVMVDEPKLTIEVRGMNGDGVDVEFHAEGEWSNVQRAAVQAVLRRLGERFRQ